MADGIGMGVDRSALFAVFLEMGAGGGDSRSGKLR